MGDRAREFAARLPVEDDLSDYGRPRPAPGDPWYSRWTDFSRFEMCAWYWSHINELFSRKFAEISSDRWIEIDYTRPEAADVNEVASFLQLEGLSTSKIQAMLDRRINSLEVRFGIRGRFPKWLDWTGEDKTAFDRTCHATMQRFGYQYPRIP